LTKTLTIAALGVACLVTGPPAAAVPLEAADTVATPTFSPAEATYDSPLSVSIGCATPGATIRYTTNGINPSVFSQVYISPVTITDTTTLKARAWVPGMTPSGIAMGLYTLKAATPTLSPEPGTYDSRLSVALSTATDGASIRYTTNGREPTLFSPVYSSPIAISRTTTVKAKAVLRGWSSSDVATGVYTLRPAITLVPVAEGLGDVVAVANAGDGSGRLFVTLQEGRVVVLDGTQVLPTPFLDIRSDVAFGGEQGLLSIAFHPGFPTIPYFYADYTRRSDGATVIARYRLLPADPNRADPASAVTLLVIGQPFANHNGGQLQFGPDGYLYIGMGDGGSANDPLCLAQRDDTLLGKMLRIDVDQNFDTSPYYGIPPTNPMTVGPPEAWANGLRNPWRFSFDRMTGDLLIGDVGQGAREEVDFEPAGAGGGKNYGWKVMEGTVCGGGGGSGCPDTVPACHDPNLSLPILEYDHSAGRCSITGGYRYRGSQNPLLSGYYVYADYCSGEIFGATPAGDTWTSTSLLDTSYLISSFGEDEAGELYVARHGSSGGLYKIVPRP
jgi:glucose/arabinose dehydrogenase